MQEMIDKIKRRLGIALDDTLQDKLLQDVIEDAESYFKLITGAATVDSKYHFIITDVALKLYARKGSEGTESESVDGYSVSYAKDLFGEYLPYLKREFNLNDEDDSDKTRRGRVMFY
ncbi:phage head-tail connector protein [Aerococcus urinae]|uniref:phage head-tail connector protein n=1 Tax=Aerococcus urinae TaxID=1376 RepID=UPI00254A286A|nr:phage head-tail connector protein [Aerococcus urinae]MDK6688322.1 phage head-tail connector protein [Aerococcus urinae]